MPNARYVGFYDDGREVELPANSRESVTVTAQALALRDIEEWLEGHLLAVASGPEFEWVELR